MLDILFFTYQRFNQSELLLVSYGKILYSIFMFLNLNGVQ